MAAMQPCMKLSVACAALLVVMVGARPAYAQPEQPAGDPAGSPGDVAPEAKSDAPERPKVSSAKKALRQARKLRRQGNFAQAVAMIEAGLELDARNLKLLQLRGAVLLDRLDYDGAIAAYEAFLAAGPRGANKRQATKILGNLEIARNTFLKIRVENGPAKIYLHRKQYGVWCVADPECQRGIVPRTFRVYVEREGFEAKREIITINAEQTNDLAVTLEEKPSMLEIEVTPAEAEVSVDGNVLGAGPQKLEVPAGEHQVRVSLDGFTVDEETVTAREGKAIALSVELIEVVKVNLATAGAELTLDGDPVTLVDGAIPVSPGPHTLVATARGYIDATVEIPAERERGYGVDVELEKKPEPKPLPPPPPPPPAPPSEWNVPKIAAVSALGVVAGIGFGLAAVDGGEASSKWKDAEALCLQQIEDGLVCLPEDLAPGEDARDAARRANTEFALGTVALVGGLAAWNWRQPAPESGGFSLRRKISLGVTAGVAAAGIGTFAVYQFGKRSVDSDCMGDAICERDSFIADEKNSDDGQVAVLGLVVGGVALGGGAYLWLTAPDASESREGLGSSVQLVPRVGRDTVGLTLSGGF